MTPICTPAKREFGLGMGLRPPPCPNKDAGRTAAAILPKCRLENRMYPPVAELTCSYYSTETGPKQVAEKRCVASAPFGHGSVSGCEQGMPILSRDQRKRCSRVFPHPAKVSAIPGRRQSSGCRYQNST